ncbi:hypothetical protein DUI87_07375 [Hirundo rustica rustica]|uniref:Uncharacterized protein n=1 Tax=Hirundo rustica rustica TaxID=333673 RepID=A0A3M0KQ15_HIRRU|nr:hypothetical protein DUI87_07375 [Hirundo rustica rustica]
MDSGIELTLSKFSDSTKLCSVVNMLDGREAIHKDFSSLERWDFANLMKFNRAKFKPGEKKALGDLLTDFQYQKEAYKKDEEGPFTGASSDRKMGYGFGLKEDSEYSDKEKLEIIRVTVAETPTLGTETCMINEDALEEGPSTSRVSLRDPVYKKRLLQTENVNLGDNRLTEYVIKCSPSGDPGLDAVLLIVAVQTVILSLNKIPNFDLSNLVHLIYNNTHLGTM